MSNAENLPSVEFLFRSRDRFVILFELLYKIKESKIVLLFW